MNKAVLYNHNLRISCPPTLLRKRMNGTTSTTYAVTQPDRINETRPMATKSAFMPKIATGDFHSTFLDTEFFTIQRRRRHRMKDKQRHSQAARRRRPSRPYLVV